jgi:uncharacterized phage protein gp47/JayE
MPGLTTTGFDIKALADILTEIEADELANIDADLNVEADSVFGQLNGIFAAQLFELWELVEEVYQAAYPDTATGQALSYIAALTGTIRSPATKTTINVSCTFTGTPTLPIGTTVYVTSDPDSAYELLAAVPLVTSPQVVTFTAVTAGAATTIVNSDPLTIDTPVTNWTAAAYVDDTVVQGADEETDAELRARREDELARPGTGTVDSMRTDILDVDGVVTCTVFENPTGVTDANLVPPHAIEVLITGTYVDNEVAQKIWDNKPAGTETVGSLSGTASDTAVPSTDHTIYFNEPTAVPLHVAVTLVTDADTYAGDTAVEDALIAWFGDLTLGTTVYSSDLINIVMDITGVEDVTANLAYVKDSDPPTGSYSYVTGTRELPTLIAANIDIT